MTMTDTRPTIACPSWCTATPGHLDDEEGVLHTGHKQLALDLPAPSEGEGGRTAGSSVEVWLSMHVNLAAGTTETPTVFVRTTSGDFGDCVQYTPDEARQVAQAMVRAAELAAGTQTCSPVLDDRGQVACLDGYVRLNP